jgi:SAM-dependent methyltransferase
MKSNRFKDRFNDFLLTTVLVATLLCALYLMPPQTLNIYTGPLMILLLIPTIMALINGAPFVPTPMDAVERILLLAKIKSGEKVYDIGCGDGRMVYLAAKEYGADATGFELSPLVYVIARIRHFFWRSKAKIHFANFKRRDLSGADVIVCYLLPETLTRLQEKLDKEVKKGARIISYAFPIGNWTPSLREERNPAKNIGPIWVYVKE